MGRHGCHSGLPESIFEVRKLPRCEMGDPGIPENDDIVATREDRDSTRQVDAVKSPLLILAHVGEGIQAVFEEGVLDEEGCEGVVGSVYSISYYEALYNFSISPPHGEGG